MKKSLLVAFVMALGVAAWIASGQFEHTEGSADAKAAAAEKPIVKDEGPLVKTQMMTAQPRVREVLLRGRTEASRWVDLKAETAGRVVAVPVRKGSRVKAGDVIVELAVENREARLTEARALVQQREIERGAAVLLFERGFRPQTKVAEAAALLESARARQTEIEMDLTYTKVRAPFGGILETRPVEVGDVLARGTIVARVIDQDPFLVVGQIAERDVVNVKVGDIGRAKLPNGEVVEGRVRYIASTADERTRTFRIELEMPGRNIAFRDGITADIHLKAEQQMAHRISPAILTLNDAGELGLRAVVDNQKVRFYPVQILDDTPEGVWVAGLPAAVEVIIVGQEFARDGATVRTSRTN